MKDRTEWKKTDGRETRVKGAALTVVVKGFVKGLTEGKDKYCYCLFTHAQVFL